MKEYGDKLLQEGFCYYGALDLYAKEDEPLDLPSGTYMARTKIKLSEFGVEQTFEDFISAGSSGVCLREIKPSMYRGDEAIDVKVRRSGIFRENGFSELDYQYYLHSREREKRDPFSGFNTSLSVGEVGHYRATFDWKGKLSQINYGIFNGFVSLDFLQGLVFDSCSDELCKLDSLLRGNPLIYNEREFSALRGEREVTAFEKKLIPEKVEQKIVISTQIDMNEMHRLLTTPNRDWITGISEQLLLSVQK